MVVLPVLVALVLAAPAQAQQEPPSAVDQYVELVPTAEGPAAPGVVEETRTPLPPAGEEALEQAPSDTAAPLDEIATSSTYGAPTSPEPPTPARRPDRDSSEPSLETSLATTLETLGSTDDGRLAGLFVVLALTAVGAVALAVLRARGGS